MATNPNVPASQAAAAEGSAPNAKVTGQQPAQLPTGNQTAAQASAVPATNAQPVSQSQGAQAVAQGAKATEKKDESRKDDIAKEQETLKSLDSAFDGKKDYFEQQEEFAKVFEEREGEDSFRRAARIEREREALLNAGDPTKDPVAKQRAMDMNTVLPGAVEDAQKIKDIGARKLEEQSEAFKGVK